MPRAKFKLKPFEPKELDEQVALFEWIELAAYQHPELLLLHASLNGVKLPIGLAVKAHNAGMKAGVPDMFLPYPRNGKHGMFIELKRRKSGVLSPEQKWWVDNLRLYDYHVVVPHGASEAITAIKEYLGI